MFLWHLWMYVVWHLHASSFTAVPLSVVSMAITQALVARGNTTHNVEEAATYVWNKHKHTLNFKLTLFCLHLQELWLHLQGLDLFPKWPVSSFNWLILMSRLNIRDTIHYDAIKFNNIIKYSLLKDREVESTPL